MPTLGSETISGKPLKNDEKSFLFLRYLNFCLNFFGHVGKRLDKKAKVYFRIYDVINREANNCNIDIDQYFKK